MGLETEGRRAFVFCAGLVGGETMVWTWPAGRGLEIETVETEEVWRWWVGRVEFMAGVAAGAKRDSGWEERSRERGRFVRSDPWQRAFESGGKKLAEQLTATGSTRRKHARGREQCAPHASPPSRFGYPPLLCPQPHTGARIPPPFAMQPALANAPANAPAADFQLALPFLLAPISPALAALHATRAIRLGAHGAALANTHCPACGRLLAAHAALSVRSAREKCKRKHGGRTAGAPASASARVLRRSCTRCGHTEDVPLPPRATTGAAPALPRPRDRARQRTASTRPAPAASPGPAATAAPAAAAAAAGSAIARPPRASRAAAAAAGSPSASSHVSPARDPAPPAAAAPPPVAPLCPPPIAALRRPAPRPSAAAAAPPPPPPSSSAKAGPPLAPNGRDEARGKARPKKKAGLQNMLARNRERQEQEKRDGSQGQGLSAFLQGL